MTSLRLAILGCLAPLCVAACDPSVGDTSTGGSGGGTTTTTTTTSTTGGTDTGGTGTGGSTTGGTDTGGTGTGGSTTSSGGACGSADWADASTGPSGTPLQGDGAYAPAWAKALDQQAVHFRSFLATTSEGDVIWAGLVRDLTLCGQHGDGNNHAFVAKLLPNGAPMWLTELGGGDHSIETLAVGSSRIVIGGHFTGKLEVGGTVFADSNGANAAFVAQLDEEGAVVWARATGSIGAQQSVTAADVDDIGYVAIAGFFEGSIDWGSGQLTSTGGKDIFAARIDESGIAIWTESFGNAETQVATGVASNIAEDVVVHGYTTPGLDLGGAVIADEGSFLLKLDGPTGQYVWSQPLGDRDGTMAAGPDDAYYLAGFVTSGAPYLAKYGDDGALVFDHVLTASPTTVSDVTVPAFTTDRVVVSYGLAGGADFGGGEIASSGSVDIAVGVFDLQGVLVSSLSFGHSYYAGPTGLSLHGDDILVTGHYEESIDVGLATIPGQIEGSSLFMLALAKQ